MSSSSNDNVTVVRFRSSVGSTPVQLPRRWAMLALFACVSFSNAVSWITFAPIADEIELFYGVSPFLVNSLSMVFMVVYIPLVFPASFLIERCGLRTGVATGALLNALGMWVRYSGSNSDGFALLWTGQTICAVAQAFLLSVPPRLSAVWFGAHELNRATALGVLANQTGIAVGFFVAPLVAPNGGLLWRLLLSHAVFATIACVLVLLFLANKPPVPPSFSQVSSQVVGNQRSYRYELWHLCTDRSFFLLLQAYGICVGVFYAVTTLLNRLLLPYFPGQDGLIGWAGFAIVMSGNVGDVLAGIVLDKTRRYRATCIVVYILTLASYAGFLFVIKTKVWLFVFALATVLGASGTAILVVGMEYAAEITYPMPEATSSGMLNCAAQIYGAVLIAVMTKLEETPLGHELGNWVLCGMLCLGLACLIPMKPSMRRTMAENNRGDPSKRGDPRRRSSSGSGLSSGSGGGGGGDERHGARLLAEDGELLRTPDIAALKRNLAREAEQVGVEEGGMANHDLGPAASRGSEQGRDGLLRGTSAVQLFDSTEGGL